MGNKRFLIISCILFLLVFVWSSNISFAGEPVVDYSDAPVSYGVASHTGIEPISWMPKGFVEWLGPDISPDAAPPAEDSDTYDDGVSWTPMTVGQPFDLTFQATFSTAFADSENVNVEAWIDFNQNGVFDSNERAMDWFGPIDSIEYFSPTIITQTLNVPSDAVTGNTWMRVRLWWYDPDGENGISQDMPPTGDIMWGEVEDYPVSISTASGEGPVAEAGGPYSAGEGSAITFNGAGSTGDGLTYDWDLDGNGTYETLNNQSPSYTYTDNDSLTVRLRVTDSAGLTSTDTASVNVINIAPTITLFAADPSPAYVGQPVTFNVQFSDPGADTFTFDWDFDWKVMSSNTKEIEGGTESTVTWTYPQTYTSWIYPTVWVRDDDGAYTFWFLTDFMVLANNAPTVDAGGPYTADVGEAVNLAATGDDIDGHSITYSWDLDNNGSFETIGQNVSSSWTTPGEKTVVVKARDEFGASSTDTATINVYNNQPTAAFTASPNPAAPNQTINLDAGASTHDRPDREIVSYAWDFGDGTTGGGETTTHSYSSFGNYTVTLTVTDNNVPAKTATATTEINVNQGNRPPTSDVGGPYTMDMGSSLPLDGTSSTDPDIPFGDSISYAWTLNSNSVVETTANPEIIPTELISLGITGAGTFPVELTVTDKFGLTNSSSTTLTVYDNRPTASFTANPNPVDTGETVNFNATASSHGRPDRAIVSYEWDYGDGSPVASGPDATTTHTYGTPGSYTATLTVTDNNVPPKTATSSVVIDVQDPNLLKNGSFEIDDDLNGLPDFWNPTAFEPADGRSGDYAEAGNYSLKVTGNPALGKKITQRIDVGGNAGDVFTFSGWSKSIASNPNGNCIRAFIYLNNTDGTKTSKTFPFTKFAHDWLFRTLTFTATKNYSSIDVLIGYYNQTGIGYYDDFKVLRSQP